MLSLRGGRILRPTRQSLTMRFAIPKRTMVGRNETEPWKEERGTRNKAAIPMFFAIGIPFCYVLPCFGAGCHTFGFKIATAALRPRNDTKLGRFWGKNSLLCKDFDALKGSAGQSPALPFFAILMRQRSSLARRAKEPLNKSAAALSGSFAPTYWFESLEIRKGFLQFPNLNLEQNPSPTALAIESELPLKYVKDSCDFQTSIWNKIPR